jgi:hypothetical protein
MKKCSKCQIEKSLDQFGKSVRGLFHWCKDCKRAYDKLRYKRIGPENWSRTRSNSGRMDRRNWLTEYKKDKECSICGENNPVCLDFHHIVAKEKKYNISNMVIGGYSIKKILKEISKCIILCSNCHRKQHHEI